MERSIRAGPRGLGVPLPSIQAPAVEHDGQLVLDLRYHWRVRAPSVDSMQGWTLDGGPHGGHTNLTKKSSRHQGTVLLKKFMGARVDCAMIDILHNIGNVMRESVLRRTRGGSTPAAAANNLMDLRPKRPQRCRRS